VRTEGKTERSVFPSTFAALARSSPVFSLKQKELGLNADFRAAEGELRRGKPEKPTRIAYLCFRVLYTKSKKSQTKSENREHRA
jgi:hypothetical protein